jgi:hypothetical protein
MNITIILSIISFIAILTIITLIRTRYSKFEIKPTDIVLALIPIVIYLLIAGELKTLQYGGLRIETAFVDAAKKDIGNQVTIVKGLESPLPIREIEMRMKGGLSRFL